jgi:HAD superfamily hydrolase (TIGR01458 family)
VLSAGRHTFGSAVTRRQTAARHGGVFTASIAARPGEQVQMDGTPLDVMAVMDDGVIGRPELVAAVDVATRTICAAVLQPVGAKAGDAALLLAIVRPGLPSADNPLVQPPSRKKPVQMRQPRSSRLTRTDQPGGQNTVGGQTQREATPGARPRYATRRGRGYGRSMRGIRAVLLDIDGVLTVSWRPLPGAVEAVTRLRAAGFAVALVTNTTSRTRARMAATLAAAGFPVGPGDIFTAPAITAAYLARHHPGARCLLLNSGDVADDLAGVTIVADAAAQAGEGAGQDTAADVAILGGAGPDFSYAALNRVFRCVLGGARLVAMSRGMYWRTDAGLQLDTGAFLPGLERAAGVTAVVTGKPAAAFFATALEALGADAGAAVMVGDDIEADVLAAQHHGITGVLVKTGKYRPETHGAAAGVPAHVIDSVADLPGLLGAPA